MEEKCSGYRVRTELRFLQKKFSVDKYPQKTTGNVIHMVLPVGPYYPQNKKIIFSTFHNGLIGGVNSNKICHKFIIV